VSGIAEAESWVAGWQVRLDPCHQALVMDAIGRLRKGPRRRMTDELRIQLVFPETEAGAELFTQLADASDLGDTRGRWTIANLERMAQCRRHRATEDLTIGRGQ
jgi:hypothetical protein